MAFSQAAVLSTDESTQDGRDPSRSNFRVPATGSSSIPGILILFSKVLVLCLFICQILSFRLGLLEAGLCVSLIPTGFNSGPKCGKNVAKTPKLGIPRSGPGLFEQVWELAVGILTWSAMSIELALTEVVLILFV